MNLNDRSKLPPFLHGIYVREDFDFQSSAAADESGSESGESPREIERHPTADEPITSSAMMSDDDFLASLIAPAADPAVAEPSQQPLFGSDPSPDSEVEPEEGATESAPRGQRFPFSLPWLKEMSLKFPTDVTFLVGENGCGKSTLIEAIAAISGFPVCGGGRSDMASQFGPERKSELAEAIYPHFKKRPRDGYFFRAEFVAQFASMLDRRAEDPEFEADPYRRYGGRPLHEMSHGESFLAMLKSRLTGGLYLLDEPESALSPQRQLSLLELIASKADSGKNQFIIATHSPILMTYPDATIINMDDPALSTIGFRETDHYQLTRKMLEFPEEFWDGLE